MTKARTLADFDPSNINPANLDDTGNIPSALLADVGGGGKVLLVVSAMDTSATNTNSTSYQEHSSLSITPTAENSKILVIHAPPSGIYLSNSINMGHAAVFRDSTNITTSGHNNCFAAYEAITHPSGSSITVLDTPTYTLGDVLDYSVQVKTDNTGLTFVYGSIYSNGAQPRSSSITLMEIAA